MEIDTTVIKKGQRKDMFHQEVKAAIWRNLKTEEEIEWGQIEWIELEITKIQS